MLQDGTSAAWTGRYTVDGDDRSGAWPGPREGADRRTTGSWTGSSSCRPSCRRARPGGRRRGPAVQQGRLLGILRDRTPTMAQLALLLDLDRVEHYRPRRPGHRRGLVRRFADPEDGRSCRVVLTAEGRRLTGVLGDEVAAQIAALTEGLSDTNRHRLALLAARVVTDAASPTVSIPRREGASRGSTPGEGSDAHDDGCPDDPIGEWRRFAVETRAHDEWQWSSAAPVRPGSPRGSLNGSAAPGAGRDSRLDL